MDHDDDRRIPGAFLSEGFIHAARLDAEERARKRAADPDKGWTIRTTPARPYTGFRRGYRKSFDVPAWAHATRDGHTESAHGASELAAERALRARLGLPPPRTVAPEPTPAAVKVA